MVSKVESTAFLDQAEDWLESTTLTSKSKLEATGLINGFINAYLYMRLIDKRKQKQRQYDLIILISRNWLSALEKQKWDNNNIKNIVINIKKEVFNERY